MTALLLRCPRLRRWLAAFAVAVSGMLAGCTLASAPAVTITAAQAESQAILVALQAGAKVYTSASTTTPTQASAVEQMLAQAEAANAAVQGQIPTGSALSVVEAVNQDIVALLGVMPIDPVTKVAIDAGMAVLDTFVAEQMGAPQVAPAATRVALGAASRGVATLAATGPHRAGAMGSRDRPPVPIPTPHRLPPTGSPPAAHAPEA